MMFPVANEQSVKPVGDVIRSGGPPSSCSLRTSGRKGTVTLTPATRDDKVH